MSAAIEFADVEESHSSGSTISLPSHSSMRNMEAWDNYLFKYNGRLRSSRFVTPKTNHTMWSVRREVHCRITT